MPFWSLFLLAGASLSASIIAASSTIGAIRAGGAIEQADYTFRISLDAART
jgi:hypothetical protein